MPSVVNCFHFSVSLGYKTTNLHLCIKALLLWIAFIFQYLWDTKQHLHKMAGIRDSCELLSFFSIFGIQNNWIIVSFDSIIVVNCFHFSVSLGYKTTPLVYLFDLSPLWIAFIFQYLWDTKQRKHSRIKTKTSCELLSFFSIFGIQNNREIKAGFSFIVVNCFHFSVSLGYKTTHKILFLLWTMLWIAFIFQYLWDTKQLFFKLCYTLQGCELLSFFSIFGIQNNTH